MNRFEQRLRRGVTLFVLVAFSLLPLQSRAQELSLTSTPSADLAARSLPPSSLSPNLLPSSLLPVSSLPEGSSTSAHPYSPSDVEVSWKSLPKKFLRDEKDMWLFPTQLAKGRHWLPTALVVGGTAGFIVADPPLMRKFRRTDNFHDFNNVFKTSISGGMIAIVPAGFYVASLIRRDSYGQSTALLAGEAVAHDAVLMIVTKAITRRARPSEFPPEGRYNDTFFATHNSLLGKGSSFPSGHAMMSFSVATVFAERYKRHKWVPYVAYGLAAAISFSRVSNGSHFPSDVFFGATMGYVIARYDVLRGEH